MVRIFVEIISGATCCGKSGYIEKMACQYDGILFPRQFSFDSLRHGGSYMLHYNLLRPFDRPRLTSFSISSGWKRARSFLKRLPSAFSNVYESEILLRSLLRKPYIFHATVLAAPLPILLERASGRQVLEPLNEMKVEIYPADRWIRLYQSVDLPRIYGQWLSFLRKKGIPYALLDSTNEPYKPLSDETALIRLLKGKDRDGV